MNNKNNYLNIFFKIKNFNAFVLTFIAIFVPLSASAKFSNNSINLNYKANLGSSKKIKLTQKDLINNQIVSVDLSNDNEKRNNISSGNNISPLCFDLPNTFNLAPSFLSTETSGYITYV